MNETLKARAEAEIKDRRRYAEHALSEDTRRDVEDWCAMVHAAIAGDDEAALLALLEPATEPLPPRP